MIHVIKTKTGEVYEVAKLRTADSFNLSVYHYRLQGAQTWRSLHVDTLAECREELGAR